MNDHDIGVLLLALATGGTLLLVAVILAALLFGPFAL